MSVLFESISSNAASDLIKRYASTFRSNLNMHGPRCFILDPLGYVLKLYMDVNEEHLTAGVQVD